jgi:GGDEF domain-containing protein
VINLAPRADDGAMAMLQGSLPSALEPLRDMEQRQALILLIGVVSAVAVTLLLARGLALPLRAMAAAAVGVGAGDFSPIAVPRRKDELGELAVAFRAMQAGVASSVSRMTELAHRDQLTGLPTRVLFADRLDQAIAAGSRAGTPVGVLILNLDHVGHVNDTLGRPIGDMLLREVAARLRSSFGAGATPWPALAATSLRSSWPAAASAMPSASPRPSFARSKSG